MGSNNTFAGIAAAVNLNTTSLTSPPHSDLTGTPQVVTRPPPLNCTPDLPARTTPPVTKSNLTEFIPRQGTPQIDRDRDCDVNDALKGKVAAKS